ncbi:MAG: AzlD domain-containing protein [Deltaproteobacteria bacterium]|nr:AzlD domain-containing protein [Deltaproteobacteria bacterium]
MMTGEYMLLMAGMALVTFIPRWLPLFSLTRFKLPDMMVAWLDLIPAAILSALLLPELLTMGEPRHLDLFQPKLLAAIPTFFFALKIRSFGGAVIFGMLVYWLIGKIPLIMG